MSISSMAEDAALRLTRGDSVAPTAAEAAATAAATAAAAVTEGATANEAAAIGREAAEAAEATKPSTSSGPLTQLMKYVPTETIVLYVAVQGALGDVTIPDDGNIANADYTSRWVWLYVLLGVTVLLATGLSYRAQKDAAPTKPAKIAFFEVAAAGVAFVVWALSLPSTPLRDISGYDYSAWNSVIILAGTVVIATAAYIFGKTVSWKKVVET